MTGGKQVGVWIIAGLLLALLCIESARLYRESRRVEWEYFLTAVPTDKIPELLNDAGGKRWELIWGRDGITQKDEPGYELFFKRRK